MTQLVSLELCSAIPPTVHIPAQPTGKGWREMATVALVRELAT